MNVVPTNKLLESELAADKSKTYQVGTLSYTKPMLLIVLFWLLWGDFCFTLMESVAPSILPLKLESLGASNTTIVLIMSTIPMILNFTMNPVISFRSDRFRSRWGRRIPFILVTLPFMVLAMIGVGYYQGMSQWLYTHLSPTFHYLSPTNMALATVGGFWILFSFFNTFVNAVFWYLFSDVIPEHMLARFMSWFRSVGMASTALYNGFAFQYAESHYSLILFSVALLYLLGFGGMCLRVKEGQYPPPPPNEGGKTGVLAAVKTYGKECNSLTHYWYLYLTHILWQMGCAVMVFNVFFYKDLGLDLRHIGIINMTLNIAVMVLIPLAGWLADRYHPIRVVRAGILYTFASYAAMLVFLFWHPAPQIAFCFMLGWMIFLNAPSAAMYGMLDPILSYRIFPTSRLGQFCSNNAMWRAIAIVCFAWLGGEYVDVLTKHFGKGFAYRCMPFWSIFFIVFQWITISKLYRSWKQQGGDDAYVPPLPKQQAGFEIVGQGW